MWWKTTFGLAGICTSVCTSNPSNVIDYGTQQLFTRLTVFKLLQKAALWREMRAWEAFLRVNEIQAVVLIIALFRVRRRRCTGFVWRRGAMRIWNIGMRTSRRVHDDPFTNALSEKVTAATLTRSRWFSPCVLRARRNLWYQRSTINAFAHRGEKPRLGRRKSFPQQQWRDQAALFPAAYRPFQYRKQNHLISCSLSPLGSPRNAWPRDCRNISSIQAPTSYSFHEHDLACAYDQPTIGLLPVHPWRWSAPNIWRSRFSYSLCDACIRALNRPSTLK